MAVCEVESAEQSAGPGSTGDIKAPVRTPVSGKTGKAVKVPRTTKANRAALQAPIANIGVQHCH